MVPADRLDDEVGRYCAMVALAGPEAVGHTKELLRRVPALPRDDGFEWASTLSAEVFASAEGQEGMAAFLGKRPPSWVAESSGRGAAIMSIDTRELLVLEADLGAPQMVEATPYGIRKIVPVLGGRFTGERLNGIILPDGGHDWAMTVTTARWSSTCAWSSRPTTARTSS